MVERKNGDRARIWFGYWWMQEVVSPRMRVIAQLHRFSLSSRLRTDRCISHRGKSQTYYPEHILGYGCLEDLLLSCHGFQLFLDRLSGLLFGGGGPRTALSPGLRCGGLESQFGRGPRTLGQVGDGLILLVPLVQAGHVFSGHPAGHIGSRIAAELV